MTRPFLMPAVRKVYRRMICRHAEWENLHLGVHRCASCGKISTVPGPR